MLQQQRNLKAQLDILPGCYAINACVGLGYWTNMSTEKYECSIDLNVICSW